MQPRELAARAPQSPPAALPVYLIFPTNLTAGFHGMLNKDASGENCAKHLQTNLARGPGAWWGFTCHGVALGYPSRWSSPVAAELNLQQQLPSPLGTPDVKRGQITFSAFGQSGGKLNTP